MTFNSNLDLIFSRGSSCSPSVHCEGVKYNTVTNPRSQRQYCSADSFTQQGRSQEGLCLHTHIKHSTGDSSDSLEVECFQQLGVVAHALNPSTRKAEATRHLELEASLVYKDFQASQGYIGRPVSFVFLERGSIHYSTRGLEFRSQLLTIPELQLQGIGCPILASVATCTNTYIHKINL